MTGWRRLAAGTVLLLAISGCRVGEDRPPEPTPSAAEVRPGRPTDPSTDLPAYTGPPPDAPVSAGPLARALAVDLTPVTPGSFARVVSAVATPDGGALALLSPADRELQQSLVRVGADGALGGAVALPRVEDVWGMHLLDDGAVVITGRLGDEGFGLRVVDPATGSARTTVVLTARDGVRNASGRSALSVLSRRLYLFLSVDTSAGLREVLLAVDTTTGRVQGERDLTDDVAAVSGSPVRGQLAGLLPRPSGGVTLVFDASPTEVPEDRIPTLLRYETDLEPAGPAARATGLSEGAETQSVASTSEGTVFLLVAVEDGSWLLAVPDDGGAGPLLAQLEDRVYGYALTVEPAQVWGLLPSPVGVRAVDLTTGDVLPPVGLQCYQRLDVRNLYPAARGALAIGECDSPREDTQMLWLLAP